MLKTKIMNNFFLIEVIFYDKILFLFYIYIYIYIFINIKNSGKPKMVY